MMALHCLLATQGPNGPNISPKGSMVVFDDDHSKKQALENLGHDKRVCVIYANFKAQRDGVLDSGFLRFYGKAELHESGPIHDAIFQSASAARANACRRGYWHWRADQDRARRRCSRQTIAVMLGL
jgi:hypothetical protein